MNLSSVLRRLQVSSWSSNYAISLVCQDMKNMEPIYKKQANQKPTKIESVGELCLLVAGS